MEKCCFNCPKRWVRDGKTCHSTCPDYLEFWGRNEKRLQEMRRRGKLECDLSVSRECARKYMEHLLRR